MERVADAQIANPLREGEDLLDAASSRPAAQQQGERAEVEVIYGASVQDFAVGGQTLREARDVIAGILQIPPDSPALVNGEPVPHTYRLAAGDTLEFIHHAGEKGARLWMYALRSPATASF
jgi:hypothetical protein